MLRDLIGDASFPEPLVAPKGHILQVVAKQHIISTHANDEMVHTTMVCVNAVQTPDELF